MVLREHREPPVHQALMGPQERAVPQGQAVYRDLQDCQVQRVLMAHQGLVGHRETGRREQAAHRDLQGYPLSGLRSRKKAQPVHGR